MKKLFQQEGYDVMSVFDTIYIYDGFSWRPLEHLETQHFFSSFLKKTGVKETISDNASNVGRIGQQFVYSLYAKLKEADHTTARINTLSGTICIDRGGRITQREHRAEDQFFYVLPYAYDPTFVPTRFNQYLDEVIPGDIQLVVQEFFGTCLIPSIKHEKVLCCVGTGANGKSVLFETVSYVLGKENVTTFHLNSLCEGQSTTRIMLQNRLLNYSSDINGNIWNNGIFKQLASGEPVEARRLYHDPIIIENYARLAFNSNEMPKSSDSSAGFRRRLLIVEFNKTITNPDPHLTDKLKQESPGILTWMIEGLVRFLRNGCKFSQSNILEASMNNYASSTDSVQMFVEDRKLKPGNTKERLSEIHKKYREYCKNEGLSGEVDLPTFRMRMEQLGFKITCQKKKPYMIEIDAGPNPFS